MSPKQSGVTGHAGRGLSVVITGPGCRNGRGVDNGLRFFHTGISECVRLMQ